ncbi:MAG TPA: hypothetical protein GYA07_07495 [Verrucomicrobia bacterium]|nr:hypothetical protein [Verrucomicrobiota bacterium]HOP97037.1 hypothetical protein [Verrucomicrobiota bacterium]
MKTNTVLSALLGCGLLAVSMSAAAQGIGNPSEKFSAKLNLVATPDAPERAKGTASIKAGSGVEGTGELVLQTIGLEPGDYLVRAVRASDAGTVDIGQFTIEEPPGRGRGRLKSISNAPLPEGLDARDIAQIIVSSGGVDLLVGDLADPASKGKATYNATVPLTPGPAAPEASGFAKLKTSVKKGIQKTKFMLKASNLPSDSVFTVVVDGVEVGEVSSNRKGKALVKRLPPEITLVNTVQLLLDGAEAVRADF